MEQKTSTKILNFTLIPSDNITGPLLYNEELKSVLPKLFMNKKVVGTEQIVNVVVTEQVVRSKKQQFRPKKTCFIIIENQEICSEVKAMLQRNHIVVSKGDTFNQRLSCHTLLIQLSLKQLQTILAAEDIEFSYQLDLFQENEVGGIGFFPYHQFNDAIIIDLLYGIQTPEDRKTSPSFHGFDFIIQCPDENQSETVLYVPQEYLTGMKLFLWHYVYYGIVMLNEAQESGKTDYIDHYMVQSYSDQYLDQAIQFFEQKQHQEPNDLPPNWSEAKFTENVFILSGPHEMIHMADFFKKNDIGIVIANELL